MARRLDRGRAAPRDFSLAAIAILGLTGMEASLLWLFAVLPPAVLNYILAEHYQRGPTQVASIVVMGNAAGLITIPVALYFILPG